jgi:hypothetical protein
MPDSLNIVYNAADAINHFREAGHGYPSFGQTVEPNKLLEVVDMKRRRLFCLLGFTADHLDVCLKVEDISPNGLLVVSDILETFTDKWVCRIASQPPPQVSSAHGDLHFVLESGACESHP